MLHALLFCALLAVIVLVLVRCYRHRVAEASRLAAVAPHLTVTRFSGACPLSQPGIARIAPPSSRVPREFCSNGCSSDSTIHNTVTL